MGQSHRIVNITRLAAYSPRDTGNFLKLTEFGSDSIGAMTALLLLVNSDWAGDRIAIVGAYGTADDLPEHLPVRGNAYRDITLADASDQARSAIATSGVGDYTDLGPFDRHEWVSKGEPQPCGVDVLLVNVDRHEMLDPAGFGNSRDLHVAAVTGGFGGIATALAAVLAASNKGGARGGGDFNSTSPLLGSWAGDRIAAVPALQVDTDQYENITPSVRALLTNTGEGGYEVTPDGVTFLGPQWLREAKEAESRPTA